MWRVMASSKLCSVAQPRHTMLRGHGVVCIAAPRFVSFEENTRVPSDMNHELRRLAWKMKVLSKKIR